MHHEVHPMTTAGCQHLPRLDLPACSLTFSVSMGWMVDWLPARARAPATTSVNGLSCLSLLVREGADVDASAGGCARRVEIAISGKRSPPASFYRSIHRPQGTAQLQCQWITACHIPLLHEPSPWQSQWGRTGWWLSHPQPRAASHRHDALAPAGVLNSPADAPGGSGHNRR